MNNLEMAKLNDEDRSVLATHFALDEVKKKLIFELKHFIAPSPDGLPAEFFQDFWEVIKKQ